MNSSPDLLEYKIEALDRVVTDLRQDSLTNSETLGKLLAVSQRTVDQVFQLDSKLDKHMDMLQCKFLDMQKQFSDICSIRHTTLDSKISLLESRGDKVEDSWQRFKDKKLEDMGEITKSVYISSLLKQIEGKDSLLAEVNRRKFEWKKYWVSVVVTLTISILSGVWGIYKLWG